MLSVILSRRLHSRTAGVVKIIRAITIMLKYTETWKAVYAVVLVNGTVFSMITSTSVNTSVSVTGLRIECP